MGYLPQKIFCLFSFEWIDYMLAILKFSKDGYDFAESQFIVLNIEHDCYVVI